MYFFVEGEVKVMRNKIGKLHLEVNAINSYDIPIHITYNADSEETAVDNVTVNSNATKVVENGQLIIIKEGVKYNILGIVVK